MMACCSLLSLAHELSSFFWLGVRETGLSSSENSWDIVISNARHIFSREGMLGNAFLRYREEMVVWGKPECSAS